MIASLFYLQSFTVECFILNITGGSSSSVEGLVVIMIPLCSCLMSFLTYFIILCQPHQSTCRALTVSVAIIIITGNLAK